MENLIFSINVVLPLFLLMCLGTLLRKINIFDESFLITGNKFVFKILMSTLLFYNIYISKISDTFNIRLVSFTLITIFSIVILLIIAVNKFEKDNKNRGILIQGMFRSNYVLFGIPICTKIFGESSIGITSMLIAIVVPLFNLICVFILDIYAVHKIDIKKIASGIIKNPLIIASILGITISTLNIQLPIALENTIIDISKIATPLALILLGGEFQIKKILKNIKYLIVVISFKLVIIPSIVIYIAYTLGFKGPELGTILALYASPVAVSSYTMSQQYNSNYELAGQIVFVTTFLCSFTIFVFIFVLKSIGLF